MQVTVEPFVSGTVEYFEHESLCDHQPTSSFKWNQALGSD